MPLTRLHTRRNAVSAPLVCAATAAVGLVAVLKLGMDVGVQAIGASAAQNEPFDHGTICSAPK